MNLPGYIMAALPPPVRVFNFPLRPYSLGAHINMLRVGCRFADDSRIDVPTDELIRLDQEIANSVIGDLIAAIPICHLTYEGFQQFLYSGAWETFYRELGEDMRKHPEDYNFLQAIAQFNAYQRNGKQEPPHYVTETKSDKTSKAHWTQVLLLTLQKEYGKSESEILNQPMSKTLYDYFKLLDDNEAGIELMADDEVNPSCVPVSVTVKGKS